MNKCTRCWEVKEDISIHSRRVNKNGTVHIRYICRECRRNRYTPKPKEVKKTILPAQKAEGRPMFFKSKEKWDYMPAVAPLKIKYTGSLEEIVRLGMEKNRQIMRKYAGKV